MSWDSFLWNLGPSDNGQHAQDEATYAKQQEPERQVLQLCALNAP